MFVDTCNFLPRIVCASRSICASRSRLQSVASASSGLNSSSACRFACCKLAWHSFGAVRASFFAHRILLSCVPSLLRHTPVAVHVYQVPLRLTLQSLSRTNANAKGDTGDSALLRWRWVSWRSSRTGIGESAVIYVYIYIPTREHAHTRSACLQTGLGISEGNILSFNAPLMAHSCLPAVNTKQN